MKKGLRLHLLLPSSNYSCRNDDLMKKGLRLWTTYVRHAECVGMMTWWKRDCDYYAKLVFEWCCVGMMTWWKRDCDPPCVYYYAARIHVGMMTWWKRDCDASNCFVPHFENGVGMMTWWKRDCDKTGTGRNDDLMKSRNDDLMKKGLRLTRIFGFNANPIGRNDDLMKKGLRLLQIYIG